MDASASESTTETISVKYLNYLIRLFNKTMKNEPAYYTSELKQSLFDNPNFQMVDLLKHRDFFKDQLPSSKPVIWPDSYGVSDVSEKFDHINPVWDIPTSNNIPTLKWEYTSVFATNDYVNGINNNDDNNSDDDESYYSDDADYSNVFCSDIESNELLQYNPNNITQELKLITVVGTNNARLISSSDQITMEYIEKNPGYNWKWDYVCMNPNLTLEFVLKHLNKPLCWEYISLHENITLNDVVKHPELPWNFFKLSGNRHLTMEFVLNNQDKDWDLFQLASHQFSYDEKIYKEKQTELVKNAQLCIPGLSGLIAKYI
jgi:hypothetical protein